MATPTRPPGTDAARFALPAPRPAGVRVRGAGRTSSATVGALSARTGELTVPALRGALRAGVPLEITLSDTWMGPVRLAADVTDVTGDDVVVELSDRRSARRSAAFLVGEVERFRFSDLGAAGVRSRRLDRFLHVDRLTGDDPLDDALDLRLLANQHFGRLTDVADSSTLADRFDRASVNLVCRLGSKAVGTGRVVVNGGDRSLSELEEESGGLPEHLWADGFVEASRVAVHPDYRGHGVFCALARGIGAATFDARARYIVLDSIDKLVPIYEKIGAVRLGITKKHQWSDEIEHVLAIDLCAGLGRFDRNALYWQVTFGSLVSRPPRHARELARRVPRGAAVLAAKSGMGRLQSLASRSTF